MKYVLVLLSVFLALPLLAQTPAPAASQVSNLYGFGVAFNQSGQPKIAGNALYAHLLSDGSGTYAFTDVDLLPNSKPQFTVTTNIGAGIAQKLFSIGGHSVYVPTTAGVSINGPNTGWNWSTGAMVPIKVKKSGWYVLPSIRVLKSSVSNGTGYQPIVSMAIGYGK